MRTRACVDVAQPKVIAEFAHKKTPLMVAAENGHVHAVEFLLNHALANITAVDMRGQSALHYAQRFPAVQRLLRRAAARRPT